MVTDNSTLLNNLIYLMVSNSADSAINDVLISLCNENKEILKALYRINWNNLPFQDSEVYKENFKNYLSYLKSQNDEERLEKAFDEYMAMKCMDRFWRNSVDPQKIISILDQFFGTDVFDTFLAYILEYALYGYLEEVFHRDLLDTILQRYSDTVLVKNFDKSLNEIHFEDIGLSHYTYHSYFIFDLWHYSAIIIKEDGNLKLLFWSRSYNKLFSHSISRTDISGYLESLKTRFSEPDIEVIERGIYFILEPQKGADTENTTRFIKAYEGGLLYDFFGWKAFPFTHISSDPSILSKIIVQYGQRYLNMMGKRINLKDFDNEHILGKKQINLKDFDNEHICPPAKLLAYHLMKKPYDQTLVEESITYFRGCSSVEKKGAFSILYTLLNPFELT